MGHSVLCHRQTFVTGSLGTSSQGHLVLRHSQKLQTSKHGEALTIQLYARTRAILLWATPVGLRPTGLRPVLLVCDVYVLMKQFIFN